jgi:hypothetical protein
MLIGDSIILAILDTAYGNQLSDPRHKNHLTFIVEKKYLVPELG